MSQDSEKHAEVEKTEGDDFPTATDLSDFGFTEKKQRQIIHQIDRRLVVTVGALYCVSLMDRTNLSAANIAGMSQELVLIGERYSIISLVFFITYVLFQAPSTVVVRAVGPRIHLSLITLLWGAVMIGMGFVAQWGQLAALRVVLGLFEAGFFPSCVYLLSTWYTRFEVGKRYSVFYILGSMASAFSGILAFGLMQMNGLGKLSGWRWIFVIEGLITCLLAIGGYWLLVDFPDSKRVNWRFLGEEEKAWIVARVQADRGDAKPMAFSWVRFLGAGSDLKIWGYALLFFYTTTIAYALAYFMPEILVYNMHFDVGRAQCLVAPPYIFAAVVMFITGWIGDRYRIRGPIILANMLLCVAGLCLMAFHPDDKARYVGVFLTTAGANSNVPATMSYQANNIRGQWKRAFCSATLVGFGGIGGIAGSLVFRTQDRPHYRPGAYACLACAGMTIVTVGILTLVFYIQNKRADRGETKLEDPDAEIDNAEFRYTY